jgi:carbon monoxide dehydrogenase subunit G
MKLSCKEDVNAPIDEVFERLVDFDLWERAALRRGADVARNGTGAATAWDLAFTYRGKRRRLHLSLAEFKRPDRLSVDGRGANLEGRVTVEVLQMASRRTRMMVTLEVTPRTLVARLFLQSLRLGRRRIEARFRDRVRRLAAEIAGRASRG